MSPLGLRDSCVAYLIR